MDDYYQNTAGTLARNCQLIDNSTDFVGFCSTHGINTTPDGCIMCRGKAGSYMMVDNEGFTWIVWIQ